MSRISVKARHILGDPLSDISRKIRRNLLAASMIGAFVSWTEFIPTKVESLGIDLTQLNQSYFLVLLGVVITYFLLAFLMYGIADFLIWREKYNEHLVNIETEILGLDMRDEPHPDDPMDRVPNISWVYRWSKPVAILRVVFEYVLPVIFAFYAIASLLFQEP